MPFPSVERVIYAKNPLQEVICEIRFPAILRIATEAPAIYQEAIRSRLPLLSKSIEGQAIDIDKAPDPIKELLKSLGGTDGKLSYRFYSSDDQWSVTLTQERIALRTFVYERWEQFFEFLDFCVTPFFETYCPTFVSRIGLRYINVINRNKLGLTNEPWDRLLRPSIAAEFAEPELPEHIVQAAHELTLVLPKEIGFVTIRHGIGKTDDTSESQYIIDSDFYETGELSHAKVKTLLNDYNRTAGNLFRWCITDKLADKLQPSPIGEASA